VLCRRKEPFALLGGACEKRDRDILMDVSEYPVTGWKRLFMWDFPRGSIAYDIKVGAILAFIFLTPVGVFRDQPTLDKAKTDIVMLPNSQGPSGTQSLREPENRFWLEGSLVEAIPPQERTERVSALISDRTGKPQRVVRIDAMQTTEGQTSGYVAVTQP
jgi:hypothetical protein